MSDSKITVVILTLNEELNIHFALQSVQHWVDEMIVVDMHSDDRTVEIARAYGAKVYFHDRILEFDLAKKFAIEQATNDWILLLDADEMVPRSLSEKLLGLLKMDEADVVFMPFKTYIMGKWIRHTGWWPQYHERFFKRSSMVVSGQIHNFLTPNPVSRKIYLPAIEENAIYHFNYRDAAHFLEKLNRYTTIEAFSLSVRNTKYSHFALFWNTLKEFLNRYIRFRGYRDGYRGFVLSCLMAFYRFATYVKLWETNEKAVNPDFDYASLRQNIVNSYVNDNGERHA